MKDIQQIWRSVPHPHESHDQASAVTCCRGLQEHPGRLPGEPYITAPADVCCFFPNYYQSPRNPEETCLFAKGTRSFFILQQKQRQSWLSFGTVWEAELENAASQESERIRGPQFPVPRARPLASVHRCWDSVWMAAMTRLMKGKYTVSL